VNPAPTAAYISDQVCGNENTTLDASGSSVASGSITNYYWDVDNDGTDDITTGSDTELYAFGSGGTYPVRLTVETDQGCTDALTQNVIVDHVPNASFTSTVECDGNTTTLDASGSSIAAGSISMYHWDVDNDGTDDYSNAAAAQNHTFPSNGVFPVRLTVESNLGCTDVVTQNVTVNVNPSAATIADNAICGDGTILMTAGLGANGNEVQFSIDAGASIAGTDNTGPTYTYTTPNIVAPGVLTVHVRTLNTTTGCVSPWTNSASATAILPATVTVPSDYAVCEDSIIDLTGQIGGGATTGTWSVSSGGVPGNMGPSTTSLPDVTATYTVDPGDVGTTITFQLTTDNPGVPCAAVSDIVNVIINPAATVDAGGPYTIAAGNTVALTGSIGGSGVIDQWIGGTGTFVPNRLVVNPTYDPTAAEDLAGFMQLTLRTQDPDGPGGPCLAVESTADITILHLPEVYITSPADGAQFCADEMIPLDGTYDGSASEATWTADNGAGRGVGTGTFSQDVFSLGAGPQSFTTQYTPSAADTVAGSVTIYLTSDDPPPAGPPVSEAETSITIVLNPIPITSPISGEMESCINETKLYRVDGIMGSPGSLYDWTITPIDGNEPVITELGNVAVLDYGPNAWSGTLSVIETAAGCSGPMVSLNIESFSLPLADAGPDQTVCGNEPAILGGSPSASGGSGSYLYNWSPVISMDDPTIANPTVTIPNPSTFQISRTYQLIVSDSITGCISNSDNVSVFVDPNLIMALDLDKTVCSDEPINLIFDVTPTSIVVSGYTILSVTPDTLLTIVHSTPPGSGYPADIAVNDRYINTENVPLDVVYTVLAEGVNGCNSDPKDITITVYPVPDFLAEPLSGCSPLDVYFDSYTSGNLSGPSTGYYYREQGEPTYTLLSHDLFTSYTFENNTGATKYFDVIFVAESPAGCIDTTAKVITVDPTMVMDVTTNDPLEGCTPHTVTFNNNNILGTGYYVWQWGDGEPNDTTTTEQSISHMYINSSTTSTKTYTVTVTGVMPGNGCDASTNLSIRVDPDINVHIESDIDEGCAPLFVSFTNNTAGASDHTWFYREKGTNDQLEVQTTPYVSYDFPNQTQDSITYEVIYIAENRFGCRESDTLEVLVWPELLPDFTVDPLRQVLPESTITIENNTNEGPWDYLWDFGDTITSTDPDIEGHTYANYGIYEISLEVSYGPCLETSYETTVVEPITPVVDFTADVLEGCRPLTVNFTNLSKFADPESYYWTFGDGLGWSNAENPSFTFYDPGTYTVILEATNDLGIVVREVKEFYIEVWDNPLAQFNIRPALVYVPDQPIYTANLSIGGVEWFWDFGDGLGTSNEFEPSYTYTLPGVYDIFLWTANEYGCEDSLLIEKAVRAEEGGAVATPNVFTPNPDGPGGSGGGIGNPAFNDVFLPYESGAVDFHLQIFNRWGELLFESYDKNVGWDGYYKGKLSPADVYVYKLDLQLNDGSRVTRLGDVMLLR
jgi:gliding motility-associated-like protein